MTHYTRFDLMWKSIQNNIFGSCLASTVFPMPVNHTETRPEGSLPASALQGTQRFSSHSFSVVLYCCTDLLTASTATAWGLYTSPLITCFLRFPPYVMTRTTRNVASVTYRRLPIQSTARPRISVVDWLITTSWKQNQKMLRVLLDFSLDDWPMTTVWKQELIKKHQKKHC